MIDPAKIKNWQKGICMQISKKGLKVIDLQFSNGTVKTVPVNQKSRYLDFWYDKNWGNRPNLVLVSKPYRLADQDLPYVSIA